MSPSLSHRQAYQCLKKLMLMEQHLACSASIALWLPMAAAELTHSKLKELSRQVCPFYIY